MSEPKADDKQSLETSDQEVVGGFVDSRLRRWLEMRHSYFLTRFVCLRLLGLIYFVAFLSLCQQLLPLLGKNGLLPIAHFLDRAAHVLGQPTATFRLPTIFWLNASDGFLLVCGWTGVLLSLCVITGVTNAIVQWALWALYMSFVHVGQLFYGYGWEIQLLETGFLSIFLCPTRSIRPFPQVPPPAIVIWLLRWLIFRIMIGAGLIKLRGDACWVDLTCLVYHYETQPVPNPVSWLLHQCPVWFHKGGVLFNHFVELIVPWFAFGPQRIRHVAGAFFVLFQITLIVSGNLSFLNWLTIVPALACFDDSALKHVFPKKFCERIDGIANHAKAPKSQRYVSYALLLVVGILSVNPIMNMLSRRQAMNTSFDPLALVNTYGAFGSVGEERYEVILEGTQDAVLTEQTTWLAYEFPCKPVDVMRRPCVISPYHYRLDWQMWFAALSSYDEQPWIIHLAYKLLQGDQGGLCLLAHNPFPDKPPRFIRAEFYRYEFTRLGDGNPAWWTRRHVGEYFHPLSLRDPELKAFLRAYGWKHEGTP